MSQLHINQIKNKIKEMFSTDIDLSDIKSNDPQYENYLLTRSLAAYAIFINVNCTIEEAAQSVTDGTDDNGIDAIFYSDIYKTLYLVQSKWNHSGQGEPSLNDMMKFIQGIKDLLNFKFDRFNQKIIKQKEFLENIISGYGNKLCFILIDTGARKNLSKHSLNLMNDLVYELNDTGDDITSEVAIFEEYNQTKIYDKLGKENSNGNVTLEISLSEWGKVEQPYYAIYGMIDATEIYDWYSEYKDRLFEKNIRLMLGNTDVNEEIYKTIKSEPENFWYFNNGITIIVDKYVKSSLGGSNKNFGTFKLENVSIVNGAQTVSTIGQFKLGKKYLEKVKVNVKIISLSKTPINFGDAVTKTNNRQNRIENIDFVTHDTEQIRIKKELFIENIHYKLLRGENSKPEQNSFDLLEATIALACANKNSALSVQAKRGIGKFFVDLKKGIYKELFNASTTGLYLYNCILILRKIEEIIKQQIDEKSKNTLYQGILIHGNRTIQHLIFLSYEKEIFNDKLIIIDDTIEDISLKIIDNIYKYLELNYSENVLATIFKNAQKCDDIINNCYINNGKRVGQGVFELY